MLLVGASALVASGGVLAFGAGLVVGAAGAVVMAAALKAVTANMKSIASNAKTAERSLKNMQKSVDIAESGLNALGNIAKSAMSKLTSAFDKTASKAQTAGQKLGTGFANGMKSGLSKAPSIAANAVNTVNSTLRAGYSSSYSAGSYISIGFANGMLSQLAVIRSAAAQMAAAADKAVRAKAKIHSPSKVSTELGSFWGEGFVIGIADMAKAAWREAQNLVSIPQVATPNLATAYGGELSADYDYYRNAEFVIDVPLSVDGKEFARATASYTEDELNKRQTRSRRKNGKL